MTPTYLFIDASYFESQRFRFETEPLSLVTELATQGYLRLMSVEIAVRETQRRAAKCANDVVELLRQARNASYASEEPSEPFLTLHRKGWEDALARGLVQRFEAFLASGNPIVVKGEDAAVGEVFDSYFSSAAPFDSSEKKSEFPDAFVIAVLRAWQKRSGEKIVVVSKDNDFVRAFSGHDSFRVLDSLEPVLREIYGTKIGMNRSAEMLATRCRKKLANHLSKSFTKVLLFMNDSDAIAPARVRVDEAKIRSFSKIGLHGSIVEARAETDFSFCLDLNEQFDDGTGDVEPTTGFHSVIGEQDYTVTLPTRIQFTMSSDMKRIVRINRSEVNDGLPLNLKTF